MGRPPKNPGSRMTGDLRIRVTDDQKRLIQEAADQEQADLSVWARTVLLRAAREATARTGQARGTTDAQEAP